MLPQVQRKVGKDPLDAGNGLIRKPVLEPTFAHLADGHKYTPLTTESRWGQRGPRAARDLWT